MFGSDGIHVTAYGKTLGINLAAPRGYLMNTDAIAKFLHFW